jgi:hypothetical protein
MVKTMEYKEAIIEENTEKVYYEYFNKDKNTYKRLYVDVPQLDKTEVCKTINKALNRGYNPLVIIFQLLSKSIVLLVLWIGLFTINDIIIHRLLKKFDITYAAYAERYSSVISFVFII